MSKKNSLLSSALKFGKRRPSKILQNSSPSEDFFSPDSLVRELRLNSRALGLPEGSAEPIIARVLEAVLSWLENRDIITKSDLERVVSRELERYSPDLALVYKNRDKII